MPLLRPVREGLRHTFIFQRRVHHGGRRAGHRPLHAGRGHHGGAGADGRGAEPGARRAVRRSRHAPGRRGLSSVVDAWGIPVVRIHLTPRENEIAMLRDMADAAAEMLEAAGGRDIRQTHGRGGVAHELGGARMGVDPKRAVLTPFQRLHDIANVYVLDGSGFPSSAWQNPTLTLMSLAVRSCDHLLDQWKKGEA
ncbi:MAG: hypothetical protein GEU99_17075 [Luteitalea sp.]|nr:hypothetical protein [Luteitalea sp.]